VTKIFSEAAARAPCCILIDNIDLLCYSRTAPGASELQKRIVSCLLTLMDGVSTGAEALPGVASQGNDPGCVCLQLFGYNKCFCVVNFARGCYVGNYFLCRFVCLVVSFSVCCVRS
jgi:SpoVK/Ycf46/Vps4 family AAA+-type ATPase